MKKEGTDIRNGFVFMIDALGAKKWDVSDSERFMKVVRLIADVMGNLFSKHGIEYQKNRIVRYLPPVKPMIYADTVLLSWDIPEDEPHWIIFFQTVEKVQHFLNSALSSGFMLRGACAYGEHVIISSPWGDSALGPAVAEASAHGDYFDWMGVVCAPSCQSKLEEFISRSKQRGFDNIELALENFLIRTSVKSSSHDESRDVWTVAWPLTFEKNVRKTFAQDNQGSVLTDQGITQLVTEFLTIGAKEGVPEGKLSNTVEYLRACLIKSRNGGHDQFYGDIVNAALADDEID